MTCVQYLWGTGVACAMWGFVFGLIVMASVR